MRSADPYTAGRMMNLRVEEELRLADARGLVCKAGSAQPGPLSRRGRWLLCELGYGLVSLGARLEAYALAR